MIKPSTKTKLSDRLLRYRDRLFRHEEITTKKYSYSELSLKVGRPAKVFIMAATN